MLFVLRVLLVVGLLVPLQARAMRRIAVLVADRNGWSEDVPLRHAVDDAQRLAETLRLLGGFAHEDISVLSQPTTEQVRQKLEGLARMQRDGAEEVLLLFYYSGHADETWLHLRGAPLSHDELYRRLQAFPARLKLGILDACRSGAIIGKGARPTSPFEVTVQGDLDVQGTVLLASSGADELSQEARALAGSIFSHHLVSGMRGAADGDADGRVTLSEAYRYAYHHTTLNTAGSRMGLQQPRLLLELKGRGEVVLTTLAQAPATLQLLLGEGRCFVTDPSESRLVAEAGLELDRSSSLALAPGAYLLKCRMGEGRLQVARFTVRAGERLEAAGLDFEVRPLSDAHIIRKGAEVGGEPRVVLKRQAFVALDQGRPEEALRMFERVLQEDRRDQEAYVGRARSLLAMARLLERSGDGRTALRLRRAAVLAWPRILDEMETAERPPRP